MLIHCSVFKFKPETTAAQAAQIVAEFEALGKKLPYVKKIMVGLNASDINVIRAIAGYSGQRTQLKRRGRVAGTRSPGCLRG